MIEPRVNSSFLGDGHGAFCLSGSVQPRYQEPHCSSIQGQHLRPPTWRCHVSRGQRASRERRGGGGRWGRDLGRRGPPPSDLRHSLGPPPAARVPGRAVPGQSDEALGAGQARTRKSRRGGCDVRPASSWRSGVLLVCELEEGPSRPLPLKEPFGL